MSLCGSRCMPMINYAMSMSLLVVYFALAAGVSSVAHWWEQQWRFPCISQEDLCFGGWLACDSARLYCGSGCPLWLVIALAVGFSSDVLLWK